MKFSSSLMLMLALGLTAVYSLPALENKLFSPAEEDVMKEILSVENVDSDFEILDVDDGLRKVRVLKKMTKLLVEAQSMEVSHPRKRFLGLVFMQIGFQLSRFADKVSDFFKDTWNKAKKAFNNVASNDNFKDAVNKVIPLLHSDMSVSACEQVLLKTTTVILKDFLHLTKVVSKPLCEAALAKLEDVVT